MEYACNDYHLMNDQLGCEDDPNCYWNGAICLDTCSDGTIPDCSGVCGGNDWSCEGGQYNDCWNLDPACSGCASRPIATGGIKEVILEWDSNENAVSIISIKIVSLLEAPLSLVLLM